MRAVSRMLLTTAGSILLAGTSLAADVMPIAAPSVAPMVVPTPPSDLLLAGMVGGWGGYRIVSSTDDPNGRHLAYGADGVISIPFGNSFSAQMDARYEHYRDFDSYSPLGGLVVGGHLSWRNPDSFLAGIFGAAARPYGDQIDNDSPGFYSGWGYIVGAEAQAYLSRTTFYVQAGYANIRTDYDAGPEGFVTGWFARGEARYFVSDDFMIAAEYGFGRTPCFIDGLCAPTEDAGIVHNWGVSAQFRIAESLPLYATLAYNGGRYTATEDPDTGREHVFRVGLSLAFGAGTLFENDRRGATLSLPMLPVRGAAWAEPLD